MKATHIYEIIRLITLALLFGGSSAVVFSAIVLVKSGQAQGMTIAQAATLNAPVFLAFSKVALGAAIVLLLDEVIYSSFSREGDLLAWIRCGASIVCFVASLIFARVLVPAMEQVRNQIGHDPFAHGVFDQLHHTSQIVFACVILFALVSLLTPVFKQQ